MTTILFILSIALIMVVISLILRIQLLKTDVEYYKEVYKIERKYNDSTSNTIKELADIAKEANKKAGEYLNAVKYANNFLPLRKKKEMWKFIK